MLRFSTRGEKASCCRAREVVGAPSSVSGRRSRSVMAVSAQVSNYTLISWQGSYWLSFVSECREGSMSVRAVTTHVILHTFIRLPGKLLALLRP